MEWIFDDWVAIGKALVTALVVYICIIGFVRFSGKRSTSQMNNFDWIVTVSLGSMAGAAIIQPDLALMTALAGIAALFIVQWLVTWLTVHFHWARRLVRAHPTILFFEGQFLQENMNRERVSREEILSAIRLEGLGRISEVHAVVLETDARLSVIAARDVRQFEVLEGCCGAAHYSGDTDRRPPPVQQSGSR